MRYTEGYRRGHNENDSKSFDGQKPSVGSNPTPSASEKPSHIKALRPYDWAFLFANLPLLHMIFGKKSCLPSDGLGFRQGQDVVHYVCGRKLGLIIQVAVDVCRGADIPAFMITLIWIKILLFFGNGMIRQNGIESMISLKYISHFSRRKTSVMQ